MTAAKPMRQDLARAFDEAERAGSFLYVTERSTRQRLKRAVGRGSVVKLAPGVYARYPHLRSLDPHEVDVHAIRALSKGHPDWVFCNASALLLHGVDVSWEALGTIHVAVGTHPGKRGIVSRDWLPSCANCPDSPDVVTVQGIRATTLERSTFDALRTLGFSSGLSVADGYLKATGVSRDGLDRLIESLARKGGYHGIDQARITASFADARSANGGESFARAQMIRLGFERPDLQRAIENPLDPSRPYYADFYWDSVDVAGEMDGYGKYVELQMTRGRNAERVRQDERVRESRIGVDGVRVMRFKYWEAKSEKRFAWLLRRYGIPQVTPPRTSSGQT